MYVIQVLRFLDAIHTWTINVETSRMSQKRENSLLEGGRLGLGMIFASIIVILVAFGIQATLHSKNEKSHLMREAMSLSRSLSRTPYGELVSHSKGENPPSILLP